MTCEKKFSDQLADTKLLLRLKDEKFDLALGEAFDMCFYGILELVGIKNYITIIPGSMFPAAWLGIPSTPSFLPGSNHFLQSINRIENF